MRAYLAQLQTRERLALLIGTGVILVVMFYFVVWSPLTKRVMELEKSSREQQTVVAWMEHAAARVARLRSVRTTRVTTGSQQAQSLLTLVDRTARTGRLGQAMKRVEPEGSTTVRVWLDKAVFDDVIHWLDVLNNKYGVNISHASFDRQSLPGYVNARLKLERGP